MPTAESLSLMLGVALTINNAFKIDDIDYKDGMCENVCIIIIIMKIRYSINSKELDLGATRLDMI